jgi:hypothetical protein
LQRYQSSSLGLFEISAALVVDLDHVIVAEITDNSRSLRRRAASG